MCSTAGNKSFPISLGFTPTQELYTTLTDPFPIQFNFGTRSTVPKFSNGPLGLIDETTVSSTIRYNGVNYTLLSAQLTNPTHTKWILDTSKKTKNTVDLVLTFSTKNRSVIDKYIFITVPLLNEETYSSDPAYLQGLSGQKVNGPFSIQDCISKTAPYAVYSTCLNPNAYSAICLVFYEGCSVSSTTLSAIKGGTPTTVSRSGPHNPNILTVAGPPIYPQVAAPADVTFASTPLLLTLDAFKVAVRISSLTTAQTTKPTETNATESYKCVPLDPEASVVNGNITIDVTTGKVQPLNKILADRDTAKKDLSKGGLDPGQLELYIAIFLGILASIGIIIGLIYGFLWYRGTLGSIESWPEWIKEAPTVTVTAVLFAFAGFLSGVLIR
uniref:Uncharacterized protein n=1 Tax=viral metagenome TaxID=1070528 RepID=A0A6C0BAP2_9ZZZZ